MKHNVVLTPAWIGTPVQDANDDAKMNRFLNSTLSKLHLDRPPYRELAAATSTPNDYAMSVPQAIAGGSLRASYASSAATSATAPITAAEAKEIAEAAAAKVSKARSVAASAQAAEREARSTGERQGDAELKFRQEQEIEEEELKKRDRPISTPDIPCTREHFARFDRSNYYGTRAHKSLESRY